MRNLLVFSGSCGHVTFTEIPDDEFEYYAAPRTIPTLLGYGELRNPVRIGRNTRAVYVTPLRYMICQDCMKEESHHEQ